MVDRVRSTSASDTFEVMIVGEGYGVGVAIYEYFMFMRGNDDTFRLVFFNPLWRGIAVAVRDHALYECRVPPQAK
eukprot:50687-Eustigmatos_ZCMA.PRE.1